MRSSSFHGLVSRFRLNLMALVCILAPCGYVLAQAASAPTAERSAVTPAALPTAYDVVSIRPHKEDSSGIGAHWRSMPDGLSGTMSVLSLITGAYRVISLDQITGIPDWAKSEDFDVEAKLDPENAEALNRLPRDDRLHQNMILMRALLTDRFKMKAHVETKELPVYNLVIAKGGLKIKEAATAHPRGYSVGPGSIKGESMLMPSLVGNLSPRAGRIIIDKTGLTGKYEVNLTWAEENDPNATGTGPSLFTALEEQLGLKLEPAKALLDVVVIDHIERPSEN